jgi:hypothetical protein
MGLLDEEITEMRQMLSQYDTGVITDEEIKTKIKIYEQIEKRAKLILEAYVVGYKYDLMNEFFSRNLLSEKEPIDVTSKDLESEKIYCPIKKEKITREMCLDIYGDNLGLCLDACEIGEKNKKLLMKDDRTRIKI